MPVSASEFGKGALRGAFCLGVMAGPAMADPLVALQAGAWGNARFDDRHCADNPHVVQLIAPDRLRFAWALPIQSQLNGAVRETFATILARDASGLVLRLDNETRRDEDGSPLVFDLYMPDAQTYCLTPQSFGREICPRPYARCGAGPTS